jgi:hypothetical protein
MARKLKKAKSVTVKGEPGVVPGLGELLHIRQDRTKLDVPQLTDVVNVHRALPLANYYSMGGMGAGAPTDERERFGEADAKVRESQDYLLWLLGRVEDETLRTAIAATVGQLCEGLAELGRFTPPAGIVQRDLSNKQQRKLSNRGNVSQRQKAEVRKRTLYPLIKAEAEVVKQVLSTGEKFAKQVRPGIRTRLKESPDGKGWPSISTIRKCVANPPKTDD